MEKQTITVKTTVKAPLEKVWKCFTKPEHIVNWNFAAPEWHSPTAQNDLREDGKFSYRMEARDGSVGFDFEGTYNTVDFQKRIIYTLGDDRKVTILFDPEGDKTAVEETFEAEDTRSIEMQKEGWQAILENFRLYTESK